MEEGRPAGRHDRHRSRDRGAGSRRDLHWAQRKSIGRRAFTPHTQDVRLAPTNDKQGFDILATFDQVKPSREIVEQALGHLTGKDQKSHRI